MSGLNVSKSMKIICWAALHYRLQVMHALNCHEISMKPLVYSHYSLKVVGFTPAIQAHLKKKESLIKGH